MKLWFMAALIVVMTVPVYSQEGKYRSGNFLLETCEAENPVSWDYCRAFIAGAGDGFETGSIYGGGGQPFCYPEGNTLGQAVRIVMKYLKEHPETLHYFAAELVALALIEAWPCE